MTIPAMQRISPCGVVRQIAFTTPVLLPANQPHSSLRSSFVHSSFAQKLRPVKQRRCRPQFPIRASAAQEFVPEEEHEEREETERLKAYDPTYDFGQAAPFSSEIARTSMQALVAYYTQLCKQQPFIARRLVLALASIVLSKVIGVTVPFYFKRIVDLLMQYSTATIAARVAAKATGLLVATVVLHALARVFASLAHEMRNAIFAKAGQRIGRSITATSFAHIHSLEAAFHNASRTGAITRVIDRGTRSVMTIFRAILFAFAPSLFELLLVCGILVTRFSPLYVVITLATFVAFITWTLTINDQLGKVRAEMNFTENEASAKLADSLINVEAVKSFDNARFELSRYDESLTSYERIAVRNEWLFAILNMGQGAIFTTGLTFNLLLASKAVMAGSLSVGSVVMLATMLQQLWVPLNFLGWQYREVKQSLVDLQNLFDILRRQPKIADAPDATELEIGGGEIVFENVTFSYPEMEDDIAFTQKPAPMLDQAHQVDEVKQQRKLALDGLSFRVPAGKSVALVGSSGSGKSTVTRLLYRLYDLSGGRILIDGQDISKASISSLRQAVSMVPQDTALFNDTIAYNIRYGRPSATDEEVIAAAKAASIHDVIERTANGYQTLVGERGVRLSGGERQRLSVARAFLKGSRIIIEDESTSALDTLTEMEVSAALQKLGVNRTRIIVAHRLSTIMNADHIVVMKLGRKVEEGTFEELLAKPNGIFKGMWERQQSKDRQSNVLEESDMSNGISEENGVDRTENNGPYRTIPAVGPMAN